MKFRPLLLTAPCLLLLAACGPSAHEQELQSQVDQAILKVARAESKAADLQSQLAIRDTELAAANQHLVEAKAEIAAMQEEEATSAQIRASAEKPKVDVQYLLVKRQYTPGKFITVKTAEGKDETQKVEPLYELTFKGVQTGKLYPVMPVKEPVYTQYKEGATYSRDDLNRLGK